MNKTLIADAGATKIDWILADTASETPKRYTSRGINALLSSAQEITRIFGEVRENLGGPDTSDALYYYGAGCATPLICGKIKEALSEVWPATPAEVESDMTGAARALFGDKPGVACILGTGSNSCLYDGKRITDNIPALGYILGDEGSGAALGKRLVGDVYKRQLPEKIRQEFLASFGFTQGDILERVYRSEAPSRFLASLVPFIHSRLWNPYIYSMVLEEFKRFFKRNVAMYQGNRRLPIGFVGSIATNFEKILREAAASQGFEITNICQSPAEGLVKYHTSR